MPTNNGKSGAGFWDRAAAIRAAPLTIQQKWLLRCLADYAGDDGECFVSRERLAADISLGERQVSKIVGSLVRLGIVSIDLRPHRTNIYRINWDRLESAHSSSRNSETGNSSSGNSSSPLPGTPVRPTGNCSSRPPGTAVPTEHSLNTHSTPRGTLKRARARFERPSLDEVKDEVNRRGSKIDAEKFHAYYEANGWVQGKGKPIKNWKAALTTWERNEHEHQRNGHRPQSRAEIREAGNANAFAVLRAAIERDESPAGGENCPRIAGRGAGAALFDEESS